jgi:hypothetical protein
MFWMVKTADTSSFEARAHVCECACCVCVRLFVRVCLRARLCLLRTYLLHSFELARVSDTIVCLNVCGVECAIMQCYLFVFVLNTRNWITLNNPQE